MMSCSIGHRNPVWQRLAAAWVLLSLSLFIPFSAHAAVQQIHIVAAGVDHSSSTASALAMDYARKRAIYLAAKKMGVKDAGKAVAKLSPEAMNKIIRGATVVQTKREGDVTYAEVNVTIVEEMLRKALNIPEGSTISADRNPTPRMRGVLLLPMYVTPNRAFLWEKENVLHDPLADEVLKQGHGAILIPAGDYDDLRLIDYQNALTVTAEELKPMFARYGASEIIIAILTPGPATTSMPDSVLLRRLSPKVSRNEILEIKPDSAEETVESRLSRTVIAIAGAITQIASSTAEEDQEKLDAATKVPVSFAYATPRELAEMQSAIRGASGVILLDLSSISLKDMSGIIYLNGDKEKLKAELVKKGILISDEKDHWVASTR